MLSGVILAAGDSTRMGSPKALLSTRDGRPFVVAIADTFAQAGLESFVVTGRDHDRIAAALAMATIAPLIVTDRLRCRSRLAGLGS